MTVEIQCIDREIIAGLLLAVRTDQVPITYGDLSKLIEAHTSRRINPHMGFNVPLGRVQDACAESGVPCLSALVVNKAGDHGGGFIGYWRKLHPESTLDDAGVLAAELQACREQEDWSSLLELCGMSEGYLWSAEAGVPDLGGMDANTIASILDQYYEHLSQLRTDAGDGEGELYKWRAARRFQEHWDIDAPDFAQMLEDSLDDKKNNLLVSRNYFPVGMLVIFAGNDPERVRGDFKALIDEDKSLIERMKAFTKASEDELKIENQLRAEQGVRLARNAYQDKHAISTYLYFIQPERHYVYRSTLYKPFAALVGASVPKDAFEQVVAYEKMCDRLLAYIETCRPEIIERSDELLGDLADVDPAHHLLALDIVFFASWGVARTWVFAPGEEAKRWAEFRDAGIMAIGWDKIGDRSTYSTKTELKAKLAEAYGQESPTKAAQSIWAFTKELKPGDIVYAREGLQRVIGRGVVTSRYRYDDNRESYKSVRDVEWTPIEPVEVKGKFPRQTLSELTESTSVRASDLAELVDAAPLAVDGDELTTGEPTQVEEASLTQDISGSDQNAPDNTSVAYWWLNASPKIWSFSDIEPGQEQSYTVYNANGNPRKMHENFLAAKKGDLIVGYDATPVKKAVCLCRVSRENDGESLYFKKIHDLAEPVAYADMKQDELLAGMQVMKQPLGSLFKLTREEYNRVLELAGEDEGPTPVTPVSDVEPYTDDDFLHNATTGKVYVTADELATMKRLLERKRNLILQGAPGTGKTFCAKRLAWAMMGERDKTRIEFVQFHQNTTYDDMMAGYRPADGGGYEAVEGVFLRFCDRAAKDPDHKWFFIIDEINRANISKVFGEMLMLIERDHRGESVRLPVLQRPVSVPDNVYIIGMMNTADRGLALIDYALRRRFAFFEMQPAFANDEFKKDLAAAGNDKLVELARRVEALNKAIADDPAFGPGFCIGHSYFCLQPHAGDDVVRDDDVRDVIEYELAPLLREYWFDDVERAKAEIHKLEAVM